MRLFLALCVCAFVAADASAQYRRRAAVTQCPAGGCPPMATYAVPASQPTVPTVACPCPICECKTGQCPACPATAAIATAATSPLDALAEVNAKRAARGLRPFIRDEGLTRAAQACASYRAAHLLFGHTQSDFVFLPPGTSAAAAGCAAYPASYGFLACCVYDHYTYAGAASVRGPDGRVYHHIFVR